MDTQLMHEYLNSEILSIISDHVLEGVEQDEDHQLWLKEFNEAIKAIAGKVSEKHLRTLENAPWSLAMPYGYDMFTMALRIGRDPSILLHLPERVNKR